VRARSGVSPDRLVVRPRERACPRVTDVDRATATRAPLLARRRTRRRYGSPTKVSVLAAQRRTPGPSRLTRTALGQPFGRRHQAARVGAAATTRDPPRGQTPGGEDGHSAPAQRYLDAGAEGTPSRSLDREGGSVASPDGRPPPAASPYGHPVAQARAGVEQFQAALVGDNRGLVHPQQRRPSPRQASGHDASVG
jgi:hypothetical protein